MADDVKNAQETNINYSQLLLQAVESHFIAKKTKAIANLNNYLQHPAAIGEHPDLVAAVDEQIDNMAHAEDKLEVLNKHYGNHPDFWMKD